VVWRIYGGEKEGNRAVSILVACITLAFIGAGAVYLNLGKKLSQLDTLFNPAVGEYINLRIEAREATLDLFKDAPLTGWGAGSFRHAFPDKQQHYEKIYRVGKNQTMFWDHAHNDYVQGLAELGILGMSLPFLALGWLVWHMWRLGGFGQPAFLLIIIGLGLIMAHSWMDFPLYNPAILTTFCAIGILTRLARLF
jgi:O-antigen ligase